VIGFHFVTLTWRAG